MKELFYIVIFTSTFFMAYGQVFIYDRNGTVKRQKHIVNQNCPSFERQSSVYAGLNYLVDEPKSVSEKNFKNYILSSYPNGFPKMTIHFYIVFQLNLPPCCRQIDIADSLTIDAKKLDFLTDLILKYPVFNQVQFNKDERVKYLSITVACYKRSELTIGFL